MNTTVRKQNKNILKFTPSVNIIRDSDSSINYIPTTNARLVFNQLINDYKSGVRSFNIVGAYGTGKSSFLWAFERNLNQKTSFFVNLDTNLLDVNNFTFLRFVGEYSSVVGAFAESLGINTKKDYKVSDIFKKLDTWHNSLLKSRKGLVILIDEFGKYLEYAAKNNPENELYFIQRLAEFANDPKRNIFFITTLHQDFNGYSRNLTKAQQNEWDKVKGRLKEVTFNEPVEQLLFLASERISKEYSFEKGKHFQNLFQSVGTSKAFPLKDYFNESFAEKLLPFDILSAAVLTLSLQKYGQNERSLFSFIESNDQYGIKDFSTSRAPYYNLSCVYDYLLHNYYSFLTTRYNPHNTQWAAIRVAIERAEGFLAQDTSDAVKLIKTIGLLNIFASASAKLNEDFFKDYAKFSLGIKDPGKIIKALVGLKIIRFVKYSNKFILSEGLDFDIDLAIDEAGNLVERVSNVVHPLISYFDFPYISAKASYFEKGTPRVFAFHLSETPELLSPEGEIDGFVNLVFSDVLEETEIRRCSKSCEDAVLYGWYKNTTEIRNLIFEIEKVKKVKETHSEDRVAIKELNLILQHQVKLLNHYVLGNLYTTKSPVIWYYKGVVVKVTDRKSFNRLLSEICNTVYSQTPIFRNEMVNKTKLSGAIAAARKNFLNALTLNSDESDFGFDSGKFPPEKTIYLSLIRETGIHRQTKLGYTLGEPTNKDLQFQALWKACCDFLSSTRTGRRNVNELLEVLLSRPFKLKQGFIDFWLPVFLYIKRDDFALFDENVYVPFISHETLELISKDPKSYEIKAFDIEGVKLNLFNSYRTLLNQSQQDQPTSKTFIETIRPFLTFYSKLPEYAKTTKKMDKGTMALRQAIAQARDPEDTFFEKFPKALGFSIVQLQKDKKELATYIQQLENCIKTIRTCYDELLLRFESFLLNEIIGEDLDFRAYKEVLQERFRKIKKHLLLPYQKAFYVRVNSEIEDRKDWLNSIAQVCIGKHLENISDDDEKLLYEKVKDVIHELDNLCEISRSGFDENKEIAFKLEVTSFVAGLKKNLVRLPISKNRELIQLHGIIKARFSDDRQLNIATLAKLLEELLKDDK
jgi:hypothetical protein